MTATNSNGPLYGIIILEQSSKLREVNSMTVCQGVSAITFSTSGFKQNQFTDSLGSRFVEKKKT